MARGQGSLEYLLLIGGAVLMATIVLILVIGSSGSVSVDSSINTYSSSLENATGFDLSGGGGSSGGGTNPDCGDGTITPPEVCDTTNFNGQTCASILGASYEGTLTCLNNCSTIGTGSCTPISGGGNPDTTPPSLSLSGVFDDGKVTLTYSVNDAPENSYNVTYAILRSTDQAAISGVQVSSISSFVIPPGVTSVVLNATSNVVSTTLDDAGLTNGTTYYYLLAACDNATPTQNCALSPIVALTPHVPSLSFVLGGEQTVFDWSTQACNQTDIPDLPAHAVKYNGQIIMTATTAPENFLMKGSTFNNLAKVCTPSLASGLVSDPSSYNTYPWLVALYVIGSKIHALVHHEYHDPSGPPYCNTSLTASNPCTYWSITYASSTNGVTFTQPSPPNHALAAPPLPWNKSVMQNYAYGYSSPTNIVQRNGYYYSFFPANYPAGTVTAGTCIMRTNNLDDPSSWRAWDGTDFTIAMTPPYTYSGGVPPGTAQNPPYAAHCTIIPALQYTTGSVTWNTYLNKYIAVTSISGWVAGTPSCGIFYSLSDDLINWSPMQKIKALDMPVQNAAPNCVGNWPFGQTFNLYGTLLDETSTDPNFETSGKHPTLYWTRINNYKGNGNGGWDRDLIKQPVTFCLENDPQYPNCT